MAKKRRRKSKGEQEDELLSKGRWSMLNEQRRLETLNHTQAENDVARRRCREFLEGGWGSIDWV